MLGNNLRTIKLATIPAPLDTLCDPAYLSRLRLEAEAAGGGLITLDHLRKLVDQFDNVQIDESATISPTEQAILAARNWVSYLDAVSKQ